MKLTKALKSWCSANCDVKQDAGDDEFRKAAGTALATGNLSAEKYLELTKTEKSGEAGAFADKLDSVAKNLEKLTDLLTTKAVKDQSTKSTEVDEEKEEEAEATNKEKSAKGGTDGKPSWYAKMVSKIGTGEADEGETRISVKGAWENYSTTKSAMRYPDSTKSGKPHPMAGRPVVDFADRGRTLDNPSDRDKAVAGAFAKFLCATAQRGGSKTFGFQSLPQHDKELLYYAMEEMEWAGATDGGDYADIKGKLNPRLQKALIDDATSGGLEAAPIVFDDLVIQAPLLNGELYPLVNTIPLERGRRIEGVSTGTVTGSWGGVDDSAISLFSTTSYVAAFDTTIYRWQGAIRIGLDFLSDTPIDFSSHITQQYGERLLEDLDDVIAAGNGTTQPEGIINKSGTTSVTFSSTTSLGNYESLRFGVSKQEHKANLANTAVFCGTETSYQRARAIPVGASDARRLGGMDYSSYSWMERPYKINSSLSNAQIFYAILGRYRMYRRRGLTMRTSTEGDTLIRANEMLMVATARYGGQLERGACAAKTADAPT